MVTRLETVRGETEKYLESLGDGQRQEATTYEAVLGILEKQHAEEVANLGRCLYIQVD